MSTPLARYLEVLLTMSEDQVATHTVKSVAEVLELDHRTVARARQELVSRWILSVTFNPRGRTPALRWVKHLNATEAKALLDTLTATATTEEDDS